MLDNNAIHIRNPQESNLCTGLYCVPTPIGNLRDITLRALDVLTACDAIICEDSRVTGRLLKAYGIGTKKKIVYNDHADDTTKAYVLSLLSEGKILALVSDAGTPLISDPGYKLVRDCIGAGHYVTALPGANAILPALQLSTLPSDKFIFSGFLPAKEKAVRDTLSDYKDRVETLVFYESPKRIEKTVAAAKDILPNRRVAIVREISKLYEESLIMDADALITHIQKNPLKGEIVIVIEGATENHSNLSPLDLDNRIQEYFSKGETIKTIAANLADQTGMKKKDIYNRALEIKNNHKP